jgi:peptidoglycan hydrolase-like protein with peptidoglycan-binding domain
MNYKNTFLSLGIAASLITPVYSAFAAEAMTIAAPTVEVGFAHNMTIGSVGSDVLKLQQFLNKSASTTIAPAPRAGSVGKETSAFGPATAAAVKIFQKENNIPQTGVVGALTRAAINKMLSTKSGPALPVVTVAPDTLDRVILTTTFDGSGEVPTVWFVYGASPDAMTITSGQITPETTKGSVKVTLTKPGTPCFTQAYVHNSVGVAMSAVTSCAK